MQDNAEKLEQIWTQTDLSQQHRTQIASSVCTCEPPWTLAQVHGLSNSLPDSIHLDSLQRLHENSDARPMYKNVRHDPWSVEIFQTFTSNN